MLDHMKLLRIAIIDCVKPDPGPPVNGSKVKSERMAVDCRYGYQGDGHETTTFSKCIIFLFPEFTSKV